MKQTGGRLQPLDLMRLTAVAYVISLRHIPNYLAWVHLGVLDTMVTYLLLGCLVFISGYVLARKYPVLGGRTGIFRFLLRRLLRVYPLYVVAVFGYVVYDRSLTLVNIVAHLLCLNLVLTPGTGEPLRTIWFVSMIVLFYVAYVGFARMKTVVLAAVAGAATVALLVVHMKTGYTDERLALFVPLFAAGIVMARQQVLVQPRPRTVFVSTVVFVLSGVAELVSLPLAALPAACLRIVWMLSGILPVWIAASWLVRKLGWGRLVSSLCYASFCAYLFHRHVYRILLLVFQPTNDAGAALYLALVGVPLAFLVGFLVQAAYDRLVLRLASR
jgi:peptidoglycan/LPS O-acetylase OafA/YrhL